MTKKERVYASVRFEKPDMVPYNLFLTSQAAENLIAYTGDKDWLSKIGDHLFYVDLLKPQVMVKPDYDMDEFGVIWNKSGADKDIGVLDNICISDWESLESYAFPEVDEAHIRACMTEIEAADDELFKICSIGFSLFERAWTLMGFENTLLNMCAEPELVHAVLDKICERNLRILDIALAYKFDAFHFGDDWGQQSGLIMGLPHWREFVKPRLQKMYDKVHQAGKLVTQHSCGDIRQLIPELCEMGLNVYQTYQPEIYTLEYAKQLHGKLAIWGAISTQASLPFLRPEEIKPLVERTIAAFGGTGLILSPTHAVEFDVPPQNLVALVEAFKHQG